MTTNFNLAGEPLYSSLGGDLDLGDLVTLFVEEMPERVTNISDMMHRHNWEGLHRIAHQIKGAAGSYGFNPITQVAGKLEAALHNKEPEENILRAAQELIAICQSARSGTPQD